MKTTILIMLTITIMIVIDAAYVRDNDINLS
jgi:hypothetical protein